MGIYYEYGPHYADNLKRHQELIPYVKEALDKLAAHIDGLDMDDPVTRHKVNRIVRWLDKAISIFFKEGKYGIAGPLVKTIVTAMW